jgi:hypothetical protein
MVMTSFVLFGRLNSSSFSFKIRIQAGHVQVVHFPRTPPVRLIVVEVDTPKYRTRQAFEYQWRSIGGVFDRCGAGPWAAFERNDFVYSGLLEHLRAGIELYFDPI